MNILIQLTLLLASNIKNTLICHEDGMISVIFEFQNDLVQNDLLKNITFDVEYMLVNTQRAIEVSMIRTCPKTSMDDTQILDYFACLLRKDYICYNVAIKGSELTHCVLNIRMKSEIILAYKFNCKKLLVDGILNCIIDEEVLRFILQWNWIQLNLISTELKKDNILTQIKDELSSYKEAEEAELMFLKDVGMHIRNDNFVCLNHNMIQIMSTALKPYYLEASKLVTNNLNLRGKLHGLAYQDPDIILEKPY